MKKTANALIAETSPYLLQHAYNPVQWMPWGEEALKRAKKEDKLLLISIGYSACHWCHVMEHECFENDAVAEVMNAHFINIKVDREERPDIDHIYMRALQLMTGGGGWPLNVIALPDGRPIWGGTYFKAEDWKRVLKQIHAMKTEQFDKVLDYAERLTEGIQKSGGLVKSTEKHSFNASVLAMAVEEWMRSFDSEWGGYRRAPKFPLPDNLQFLLKYAKLAGNEAVMDHVQLTLFRMAEGGIYDQLRGGFARYSVDGKWKLPHFEKMLYDNAQLIALYADAYRQFNQPYFAQILADSIAFVEREWTDASGLFHSALDADSEGEEGKFYVWKKAELQQILGADYDRFAKYFRLDTDAYWEHGNYILMQHQQPQLLAKEWGMTVEELNQAVITWKKKLLAVQDQRVRPGLDDKSLCSWNALMVSAYAKAYQALLDKKYSAKAHASLKAMLSNFKREDGGLWRNYKQGKSNINAYLDDYACLIRALLDTYSIGFDESLLHEAKDLCQYCLDHFYEPEKGMFGFTSDLDPALISRTIDVDDNVIPSSNAMMANNLFDLGRYFMHQAWEKMALNMLGQMQSGFKQYPSGHSHWGQLALKVVFPCHELVYLGPQTEILVKQMQANFHPQVLLAASQGPSALPLLKHREASEQGTYYLCQNKTCLAPQNQWEMVVQALEENYP